MVVSIDEHEGLLIAGDVTADSFSEHLLIAVDIEIVVLQLEGQTDELTKLIETLSVIMRCSGQQRAHLQGTSQQDAGLQTYHFEILLLADIRAGLKVDVVLLSFSYLQSCGSEELKHLRQFVCRAFCHPLISEHEHRVARENRLIGVPPLMHRLVSAPQVGVVHQVIMEKCIVVISLQSHSLHENALRIILIQIVSQQHQHGPHAFATHRQHILHRLIKAGWLTVVRQPGQEIIDLSQQFRGRPH